MEPNFIDIHTHKANSSDNLIQIVNLDLDQPCPEQGYYSYGIHPWALDNADFPIEEAFALLEERLKSPNVVALGEAGLDKMHKASFERQIAVFERQIALSEALQKPMILHDVKSHNEILALRKKHKAKQPWILHGFNGTEQDIKQLTGQGLYLSVGESILYPERKIAKSLKNIPLEYLYFETDMAETEIKTVYETASQLLEMELSELKMKTIESFVRVFRWHSD